MLTWRTLDVARGRVEIVECYPTLDEAIADMNVIVWDDPGRTALDYIANEAGEVVASAMFGERMELLVTCVDGRRLTFEQPRLQDPGGAP